MFSIHLSPRPIGWLEVVGMPSSRWLALRLGKSPDERRPAANRQVNRGSSNSLSQRCPSPTRGGISPICLHCSYVRRIGGEAMLSTNRRPFGHLDCAVATDFLNQNLSRAISGHDILLSSGYIRRTGRSRPVDDSPRARFTNTYIGLASVMCKRPPQQTIAERPSSDECTWPKTHWTLGKNDQMDPTDSLK